MNLIIIIINLSFSSFDASSKQTSATQFTDPRLVTNVNQIKQMIRNRVKNNATTEQNNNVNSNGTTNGSTTTSTSNTNNNTSSQQPQPQPQTQPNTNKTTNTNTETIRTKLANRDFDFNIHTTTVQRKNLVQKVGCNLFDQISNPLSLFFYRSKRFQKKRCPL